MGITNLSVLLKQKCGIAINNRKLSDYRGLVLGIDLSIFLYKFLYNNNDHLEGLSRMILRLLKNSITPVFIFDGKPPIEKAETIKHRKDKRDFMHTKKDLIDNCITFDKTDFESFKQNVLNCCKNEIEDEEIEDLFKKSNDDLQKESDKLDKKIIYVTHYHIESSKNLFDLFGIKYIHAPCEAEALLAILCKDNIVDGCISEDSDILVNGGHLFLRNFNPDKNNIDEYCLQGILDCLNLSHAQFIDMCILCGCDYMTKIIGMGPITAHKLICKYGNIEDVIKNNDKFIIPDNFDYIKARELFNNPIDKEVFKNLNKDVNMVIPQLNALKLFVAKTKLKEKHLKEIDKDLMSYYLTISSMNNLEKGVLNSTKITDFFSKK